MSAAFETGFVPKSIEFEGQTYRYAVWVPLDYTPAKRWPVVLFLHGMGESGSDGEFHTTVGLGKAIRGHPERFGALVVMPQMPVGCKWEGPMQDLALATLDATLREYNGDRDRIALTGLSLGGYGTWLLGGRHPEKFLCCCRSAAAATRRTPRSWSGCRSGAFTAKPMRRSRWNVRVRWWKWCGWPADKFGTPSCPAWNIIRGTRHTRTRK